MAQVTPNTSYNVIKVSSVGLQGATGAPGPTGSLQSSNSGSFSITGSLIVSGSNTFTNIGPAIFSGSITSTGGFTGSLSGSISNADSASYALTASYVEIAQTASYFSGSISNADSASYALNATSASFSSTATSASFATTASFALNAGTTVSTASFLVTASANSNIITFTKGDASTFAVTVNTGSGGGGGSTDTGSFFVSASTGNTATGTTVYTRGDGTTLTTSFGSSYQIVDGVPNVEVIAQPNIYFTPTSPTINPTNSYNIQSVFVPESPDYTSIILRLVNSTPGWGSAYSGSVVRLKESGSNTNWSYYGIYQVNPISGWDMNVYATVLPNSNRFVGNTTASINLFAQAPSIEYQSASLGSSRYTLNYRSGANSISGIGILGNEVLGYATGSTYSGTSPDKTYLYVSSSPNSGSAQILQGGQYVGFSTDNTNWTYYVVLGEVFTYSVNNNTYVTIEPVDTPFYATTGTLVYLGIFTEIPSQPYYRQLSHIQYPITPTSTADASGSIGDVSYDNNNFYVKRSNGWGKAPLLDINSGSLLTTASVSDNTLTFTKNDGSTFNLTVNTGSSGGSAFPFSGSAIITGSLIISGSENPILSGDIKGFQVYNTGDATLKATSKNSGVDFTTEGLGPNSWYIKTTGAQFSYTSQLSFHTTGSGMGDGSTLGILNWGKSGNDSFGSIKGFLKGVNKSTIGIYSSAFGALDYDGLPDISFISGSLIDVNRKIETDQDIEITDSSKGIILRSPNGTRYRITIHDSGILVSGSI